MTDRIRLYNTLSRTVERLETIDPGSIRMYVCGVTPYASAHIGHGMSVIVFDMIRRYLEHRGYNVRHVQNFTDIDDKIIVRANREGISSTELTESLIANWHEETAALNVLPAHIYPQATLEIPAIVAMIQGLIEYGHAYVADGDVYFRVRSFDDYGKLSRRAVDEMISGARIEVNERKEDPLDFALWKSAKPDEPHWPSPWSDGRPGWHIECSAMCSHHLGGQVDIHGGGTDLVFPHHENEIAQSEAFLQQAPFARYWIHNGLLQLGGDKMSKSIGNIVSIRELLDRCLAGPFRLMVLQTHYRSPLTYSEESLLAAKRGLERLQAAAGTRSDATASGTSSSTSELTTAAEMADLLFHKAMDDDFDSPRAIAALFDFGRAINRARDATVEETALVTAQSQLISLAAVLGLNLATDRKVLGEADPFVDLLVRIRDELRAEKLWSLSDLIRDELIQRGIEIADGPTSSTWRKN
ncbi:cysteine--tRNA ligase [soil metagenome]